MKDEQEMLEWLIKNQSSADDDDTIEETDEEKLEIMVDNVDNLMIIFIDNSRLSTRVLDVMETIDDDCDRRDVVFVKVKVTSDDNGTKNSILDICSEDRVRPLLFSHSQDKVLAAKYSVDEFPSLVFFENQIPSEVQSPISLLEDQTKRTILQKVYLTGSLRSQLRFLLGSTTYSQAPTLSK